MMSPQELKKSWINLPEVLFKEKLSPPEFGQRVLLQLSLEGLGAPHESPTVNLYGEIVMETKLRTKVLGEAFAGDLSPTEIAVYCYICYNLNATHKEIAKKRKLSEKIVAKTLTELESWGYVRYVEEGEILGVVQQYAVATLNDLYPESA